jgi:hypothetical protein
MAEVCACFRVLLPVDRGTASARCLMSLEFALSAFAAVFASGGQIGPSARVNNPTCNGRQVRVRAQGRGPAFGAARRAKGTAVVRCQAAACGAPTARHAPPDSRALSCFWQAVIGLRWFRDRTTADAPAGPTTTFHVPESNYGGLCAIISAEEICDHSLFAEVPLEPPKSESPGYGIAVAPRGALTAGSPVDWSLQMEWDPAYGRSQARAVTLPRGAWLRPTVQINP